jgi:thiamine pyrophosphate-dependent acetolactate synthase large subunit-like protein
MGFGLPASIGVCLAGGRQRTICVDGDGGFQFNIQELETVARMDLPIKFFVLNNGGYASIRASQTNYFGEATTVSLRQKQCQTHQRSRGHSICRVGTSKQWDLDVGFSTCFIG